MSVAHRLDTLPSNRLRQLHRGVISETAEIVRLLERALEERVVLNNGVDGKSEPRTARIIKVSGRDLLLAAPNLVAVGQPQVYLHFDLRAVRYFFAAPPIAGGGKEPLQLRLPVAVYEAERRDLRRRPMPVGEDAPRVVLRCASGREIEGRLRDWSYQGMGVALESSAAPDLTDQCQVFVHDGDYAGESRYGIVRRTERDSIDATWTRVGLESSSVSTNRPLPVDKRDSILGGGTARNAWRKVALAGALAKRIPSAVMPSSQSHVELDVVEYENSNGRRIVALVDQTAVEVGGVAVVIPPAWGRTKETLLPLARTICATLEKAGIPGTVLRFDGTNRRGESYLEPECRAEGDEYLRFTFSQAVDDIRSSLSFVRRRFKPDKIALLSFSLGSVEARRAAVLEGDQLDAWISVVGMVDLQSGLRAVSGGLDFAFGQSIGVEFGVHELVGVVADMDHTGRDALQHKLVYLEDAKRDMAALALPITWIHGRYDAWMGLERVRALLAAGQTENRRLIEIPSGHQMRSSAEALETFQLASSELVRLCFGRQIEPALPDLVDLETRLKVERARRPTPRLVPRTFWSDYLLGRDRRLGFELMSSTSPYRALMRTQIERLGLADNQHVLDLGGGIGDFSVNLAERRPDIRLRVTQLDLIPAALKRSASRLANFGSLSFDVRMLAADLEISSSQAIPLKDDSVDTVLASLVLSYVHEPEGLLAEIRRILKPGGRLVLSSMRRDADISRIYANALAELPPDRREQHFGAELADDFDELQRVLLNDAARLLQMEEEGRFQFYDAHELEAMVYAAGFRPDEIDRAFGEPPQAVVVTARNPA